MMLFIFSEEYCRTDGVGATRSDGVLIIQKTLQKGALAGFVAGMGAACADLFYATVAAFGLGFVINVIQTHELILQIIGGIFLIIVGLKIYFDNPLKQIRMKKRVTKKGLLGDFLTLFFLTVSNPVAIVVFMASLPVLRFSEMILRIGSNCLFCPAW